MKGQVVVPTLLDVRIGESDTSIKSDTASNVDAWLVREQSLKVIIIFITAITHCQSCNSIFYKVCITSLSKIIKAKKQVKAHNCDMHFYQIRQWRAYK